MTPPRLDKDPVMQAAREAAKARAELAADLATLLDEVTGRAEQIARLDADAFAGERGDPITAAELTSLNGDQAAALAGMLARLTRHAEAARDKAVMLARTLPKGQQPSWDALANAMGETDRGNLARRYLTKAKREATR